MARNMKNEDIRQQDIIQAVIIDDCLDPGFLVDGKNPQNMLQCLLPLGNIPAVNYTLSFLSSMGVQETIFYCMKNSEKVKEYSKWSSWNTPGSMVVKVIVSEQSQSMGDVMRELDASNLIQGDFILMYADTISNAKLLSVLQKHRATTQKDKGAVMTMVYTRASPGNNSRAFGTETVLALDKRNGRVLAHQKQSRKETDISFPLELFLDRPCVELCYDLLDPGISICSMTVPPLFSDNFDFQTRDDLVKGLLLNEDILGNTMYAQVLDSEYAARLANPAMFQAVSLDVIHRWTYPFVPDTTFAPYISKYSYIHKNNVYKEADVIVGKCEVENSVIGKGTKLGKGCKLSNSVIGKNCKIGDAVKLNYAFIWDNSTVESNYNGSHFLAPEKSHLRVPGVNVVNIGSHPTEQNPGDATPGYYGSETDSSDDDFDPNAQNVDEYEVFFSEVLDSLVRGFKERVQMDALIIEINASRFANNIPADEVNHWVMRAILNVPDQASSSIEKVLVFFKPILERYISKSSNDQTQCLTAIQNELLGGAKQLVPSCGKILHFLYDKDILEEESIIQWYEEDADDNLKSQKHLQDFIAWLRNAEEESETGSD